MKTEAEVGGALPEPRNTWSPQELVETERSFLGAPEGAWPC